MPFRRFVVVSMLVVSVVAQTHLGGCTADGRGGSASALQAGPVDAQATERQLREALFRDIDLSADQQAEVDRILDAYRVELKAWADVNSAELQAVRQDLQAAREAGYRRQARRALRDLRQLAETRPDHEPYYDDIAEVLTDEQAGQFRENIEALKQQIRDRARQRMRG